jgi:hypothetical protein
MPVWQIIRKTGFFSGIFPLPVPIQHICGCEGFALTCLAVVPLCGTKAEVTVPSLDDWEKAWGKNSQRSVSQSCCRGTSELARGSGSGLGKYYKTRNRPVYAPTWAALGFHFNP